LGRAVEMAEPEVRDSFHGVAQFDRRLPTGRRSTFSPVASAEQREVRYPEPASRVVDREKGLDVVLCAAEARIDFLPKRRPFGFFQYGGIVKVLFRRRPNSRDEGGIVPQGQVGLEGKSHDASGRLTRRVGEGPLKPLVGDVRVEA